MDNNASYLTNKIPEHFPVIIIKYHTERLPRLSQNIHWHRYYIAVFVQNVLCEITICLFVDAESKAPNIEKGDALPTIKSRPTECSHLPNNAGLYKEPRGYKSRLLKKLQFSR